jgi:hypothetical protein
LKKVERRRLEKVLMYLDLARSYGDFANCRKAVLRAYECLGVVLKVDGQRFVRSDVEK